TGAVSMSGGDAPWATVPPVRAGTDARRLAEGGALLVMVAWAANFVIVKDAIATAPPVGFAFVRFLLAGLVLLVVLRLREGSAGLPRALVVPLAILGALGFGVYQVLWASGLTVTTAGTSALLVATTPIWTVLVAVAMRTEAPHRARFLGAVVGFAGVALVVAGRGLSLAGVGDLLTLIAAVCWGSYLALSAPLLASISPLRITTWAILFGTAVLAIPGSVQLAAAGGAWATPEAFAAIAYSGIIAGGLANVLIFRAIAVVGPSRVANLQLLVPALAILFAAAALGEPVLAGQLLGGAVIVTGILVARRAPAGPPPGGRRVPEPTPLLEA
ncbi:MAG: DMT family transporter, partial [Chloroflexota bacterium]